MAAGLITSRTHAELDLTGLAAVCRFFDDVKDDGHLIDAGTEAVRDLFRNAFAEAHRAGANAY